MYPKSQSLLLLVQDINTINIALANAMQLIGNFNLKLIIITDNQQHTITTTADFKAIIPSNISFELIRTPFSDIAINKIVKQHDSLFAITQFPLQLLQQKWHINRTFKWIYGIKIPVVLVSDNSNIANFKNITLTVDARRESKEKMIWASLFGRFSKATLHLLIAKEKEPIKQQTINATLLFTRKLFEPFQMNYRMVKTAVDSTKTDKKAQLLAQQVNNDLIILMAKTNRSWFYKLWNNGAIKTHLATHKSPLLFINPIKDYYIPCR